MLVVFEIIKGSEANKSLNISIKIEENIDLVQISFTDNKRFFFNSSMNKQQINKRGLAIRTFIIFFKKSYFYLKLYPTFTDQLHARITKSYNLEIWSNLNPPISWFFFSKEQIYAFCAAWEFFCMPCVSKFFHDFTWTAVTRCCA